MSKSSRLLATLALSAVLASPAFGQAVQGLDGRWEGAIDTPTGGKLTAVFNVATKDSKTTTTFDSPDQGAKGIAAGVKREGDKVTFDVPMAQMSYAATLSSDGKTLSGNVSQGGGSMALTMTKKAASGPPKGPLMAGLDGKWQGNVGGLAIVLNIKSDGKNTFTSLDSPDQGATGIPAIASRKDAKVIVTLNGIGASLEADLSADGKTLTGDWVQLGNSTSVTLKKQ